MKNLIIVAAIILVLPTLAVAGNNSSPDFGTHGTFEAGVEGGCWTFVADDGQVFEPIGGSKAYYRDGLSGVVTGHVNTDLLTSCMQGPVVELYDFEADGQSTKVGTIGFQNSGCWTVTSGNETFLVLVDDIKFYVPEQKVKITGVARDNVRPMCEVDGVIEVLSYDFIGTTPPALGDSNSDGNANCHADYAACQKTCREYPCFISCENLFWDCINE